jgi:hypothetical protein
MEICYEKMDVMEVFFDTEFTTADKNVGFPALISVGCAAQAGETFYAELSDTWHSGLCSPFVIDTVLPLLEGGEYVMTEAQLAINLKEWIEGLTDREVTLRTDAPRFDWPWIEQLFTFYGCWPQNLRRTYGTVYFDHHFQEQLYIKNLDSYWQEHAARRHHALVDAKSILYAWQLAMKKG